LRDGAHNSAVTYLLSLSVVRMLWWFLILGLCVAVVVSVLIKVYMGLRQQMQMKEAGARKPESDVLDHLPPPER
jgi:hypothetical protein